MNISLQLKIGQSLSMTPQLQHAIRLLQLSSVELQSEIQEVLDSNIMIEVVEDSNLNSSKDDKNISQLEPQNGETSTNTEEGFQETIPEELPVDTEWEDVFDSVKISSKVADNSYDIFDNKNSREETLKEHLQWQLNFMPMSDSDRVIAMVIIDSLDDDGYITATLEDILSTVNIDGNNETNIKEVEVVLHMLQNLDPIGVASRDLKECLGIQLKHCDYDNILLQKAIFLVNNHFDFLVAHDYTSIMRKMRLNKKELSELIDVIQSMNPRPGNKINETKPEYIIPDVYVKKDEGKWKVSLNTELVPNLRINSVYANLIKRADNNRDNNSLKEHLQEARWFIKSLRSRSETLLQVASCIVEYQRAFLENGEEAMRPLILNDIAESLDMHESTISRVTTRKYMHTPRGLFELKYFFSSHLATSQGRACSSVAIRALIKKMIDSENVKKPMSDNKIAIVLGEQGVNIARRTIAKYREAMSIPPSNERKRFI